MVEISKIITNIIVALLLFSCANPLPPSGGEVDKIPPEIISFYPQNETTNYSENNLEIEFSEYVEKRTAQDAIFISPLIEGELDYDWSGRTLTVEFIDSLKQNTTYTISVGTEVRDINGRNKMVSPFVFTFSTGEQIDKSKIEGMVYDKEPSGVFIYAYKVEDDTLNMLNKKPDYVTQAGEDGKYVLSGLAVSDYHLAAVKDLLSDLAIDLVSDKYGLPSKEVSITSKDTIISNINFRLTFLDTVEPSINKITMTDQHRILLEFSERIDSTKLSKENFFIFDSTLTKEYNVEFYSKRGLPFLQSVISIADSIPDTNQVFLGVKNLTDIFGNINRSSMTEFSVSTKPDSVKPSLSKKEGDFGENKLSLENPFIDLKFSESIITDGIKNKIRFFDADKISIPIAIEIFDNAAARVKPSIKLKQKASYNLQIDFEKLRDAAGNRGDSSQTFSFSVISNLDYSGIFGSVRDVESVDKTKIILESITKGKQISYSVEPASDGQFSFNPIKPGKYIIWSFMDLDENGEYSFGSIEPYKIAEPFTYYSDTLEAKARWPLIDVFLEYK
ncbi:MAG: Ig-like domain-containing protein [Melioribacteraceae bacterium]|nr:Ig-like domain-containing protein [Melioribacteraceae bacterium]